MPPAIGSAEVPFTGATTIYEALAKVQIRFKQPNRFSDARQSPQLTVSAVYSRADHGPWSSVLHITPTGHRRTRSQLHTQPDHSRAVTSSN